ncbi:MAG TPA: polysaccharide deacetylase family protein, partial [Thermoanaerobaculia bacterium]
MGIRRAILTFAVVSPAALVLLWNDAPWAGVGIVFLSHMLVLYPTLRPGAQWLGPVITHFVTEQREVWLTIDDGPTLNDTAPLLDLLGRHDARATFFVKGVLVDQQPELARDIARRGHTLANHSHTHPSGTFWCRLPKRLEHEVDECSRAIERATGIAPRWF